jgi:hypothetical protein
MCRERTLSLPVAALIVAIVPYRSLAPSDVVFAINSPPPPRFYIPVAVVFLISVLRRVLRSRDYTRRNLVVQVRQCISRLETVRVKSEVKK